MIGADVTYAGAMELTIGRKKADHAQWLKCNGMTGKSAMTAPYGGRFLGGVF